MVQNLDPNTRYEFVVRLHADQMSSPWSSVVYYQTLPAGNDVNYCMLLYVCVWGRTGGGCDNSCIFLPTFFFLARVVYCGCDFSVQHLANHPQRCV